MDFSTILRRSADILETKINGEVVLLHSTQWNYLHFSGSGAAIWSLLATPTTFGELITSLRNRFDVEEATCTRETAAMLEKLISEKFLTKT